MAKKGTCESRADRTPMRSSTSQPLQLGRGGKAPSNGHTPDAENESTNAQTMNGPTDAAVRPVRQHTLSEDAPTIFARGRSHAGEGRGNKQRGTLHAIPLDAKSGKPAKKGKTDGSAGQSDG